MFKVCFIYINGTVWIKIIERRRTVMKNYPNHQPNSLALIEAKILETVFAFFAAAAGKSDQRKLLARQLLRQIQAQDYSEKQEIAPKKDIINS